MNLKPGLGAFVPSGQETDTAARARTWLVCWRIHHNEVTRYIVRCLHWRPVRRTYGEQFFNANRSLHFSLGESQVERGEIACLGVDRHGWWSRWLVVVVAGVSWVDVMRVTWPAEDAASEASSDGGQHDNQKTVDDDDWQSS